MRREKLKLLLYNCIIKIYFVTAYTYVDYILIYICI